MKYILIILVLCIGGCYTSSYTPLTEEERAAKREALVKRFQEAYPENWQQKLLEYDIERERQAAQIIMSMPQPTPLQTQQHYHIEPEPQAPRGYIIQKGTEFPVFVNPDGAGGYIIQQGTEFPTYVRPN